MTKAQRDIKRKLRVLNYAKQIGNISKACRYFGISRETFYQWKRAYEQHGETALINSKPCPENPKLRTPPEIAARILHLRRKYLLGQLRISWYLQRYHGIKITPGGVYSALKRNGLNRLPKIARKRTVTTKRCEKQIPGHHFQMDVKFLKFKDRAGKKIGVNRFKDMVMKMLSYLTKDRQ